MNITLREVYQTSADGDRFWKVKECYIRGSTIKYLRVPDALLDVVKEEQTRAREAGKSARGGSHTGGVGRAGRHNEVAVVHAADHRVVAGRAGAECDIANAPWRLHLLM
ncbi:hypothetical protein F5148DRAFT_1280766 [Russula earlei]|uniref:Uncharacterized protein n=1 Tax=Russula earlei TaxID=71964 RepID=A0ACC0UIW1_9AGAM|nr:hypothetical protein F5148DRAFT_1280766 [Russula earlei]